MSTTQYALNFYVNSATEDPPADPQPTPEDVPGGYSAVSNWRKVWRWEWQVADSEMGWYSLGDRVVKFPAHVPGHSAGQLDGKLFSIGIYDVNINTGDKTSLGSVVSFELRFDLHDLAGVSETPALLTAVNSAPIMFPVNYAPSSTQPQDEKAAIWISFPASTGPAGPMFTTASQFLNPYATTDSQLASVWQIVAYFGTGLPPMHADVSLWLQMQDQQNQSIYFYKDPEMKMDKRN